jgi:hypothetical protein
VGRREGAHARRAAVLSVLCIDAGHSAHRGAAGESE